MLSSILFALTLPLTVLDTKLPDLPSPTLSPSDFSSTQPDEFNPASHQWKWVESEGRYCNNGSCEAPQMNINGRGDKHKKKITLPAPFKLNFYEFFQASRSDFILEIKKGNQPHALLRHVTRFHYIPGAQAGALHVDLWEKSEALGTWSRFHGLIDIASSTRKALPPVSCSDVFLGKFGQIFVTYSDKNKSPHSSNYQTQVCFWNQALQPLGRIALTLDWYAFSEYAMTDSMGMLSKEPNVFWAISKLGKSTSPCFVYLQDIANQTKSARFKLAEHQCPQVELDVNSLTLQSKQLRYRKIGGPWQKALRE